MLRQLPVVAQRVPGPASAANQVLSRGSDSSSAIGSQPASLGVLLPTSNCPAHQIGVVALMLLVLLLRVPASPRRRHSGHRRSRSSCRAAGRHRQERGSMISGTSNCSPATPRSGTRPSPGWYRSDRAVTPEKLAWVITLTLEFQARSRY
jgi:hypothetical protein